MIWSRPQSAARNGNPKAVDQVVKITREFDRYYGARNERFRRGPGVRAPFPSARPAAAAPLRLAPSSDAIADSATSE